jgi:hypothetical protein
MGTGERALKRRVLRASTLAPYAGKPATDHPRVVALDYQFD